MSTSAWKTVQPLAEVASLQEIMSEEIARELQHKEEQNLAEFLSRQSDELTETGHVPEGIVQQLQDTDYCDSDSVIAQIIQKQFDREFDDMLKRKETKYNGTSKVSISLSNYRMLPENTDSDSEEEQPENIEERKEWDRFENLEKEFNAIPRCGYKLKSGNMITKHDMTMSGRRNACKVMAFPPEFQTGDGAGFDMQLPNNVFNSLKAYSRTEQIRRHKFQDKREDHATAEMGLNLNTRLELYKLINLKKLLQVNGIISTGKEAVILHADGNPACEDQVIPSECAIKIFKTTLNEFKQRDIYVKGDPRFKDRLSKQSSRKSIHLWAEKEMANLNRMRKIGIRCPEVVCLKEHILIMSFIGENNIAALKLKDAVLKPEDLYDAYEQVVDAMKRIYSEAQLVHADLSEYNILWHNGHCWFIDVSQAVLRDHPNAYAFLLRDCGNISNFFTKKKMPNCKTAEELFIEITQLDPETAMKTSRTDTKEKPHLVDRVDHVDTYNFDNAWEESKNTATNALDTDLETVTLVDPPKS